MSPLEQLQSDVLGKLLAESLLSTINVKSLRKMRLASEIDLALVWSTARTAGGPVGCGVIVGMPTLQVRHPDTPGPLISVGLPVRIYEEPTINLDPSNGTQQTAEIVLVLVVQLLHQLGIAGLCSLRADRDAAKPIMDGGAGVIGYEATLQGELPTNLINRAGVPAITQNSAQITLTAVENNASVYYSVTTDGSIPPYPGAGTPGAVLYSAPFNLTQSPSILRWAAYVQGINGCDPQEATITY